MKQCQHKRRYSSGKTIVINVGRLKKERAKKKKEFSKLKSRFTRLKRKVKSSSPKRPMESYDKLLDRAIHSKNRAFKSDVIRYFDKDKELSPAAYKDLNATLVGLRRSSTEIGGPFE